MKGFLVVFEFCLSNEVCCVYQWKEFWVQSSCVSLGFLQGFFFCAVSILLLSVSDYCGVCVCDVCRQGLRLFLHNVSKPYRNESVSVQ